ncbi:MAG: hypothetical protein GWP91_25545 [Rhodobacterales bacterium]|nr:hypothetical protein [Rhodobacterales bacterium]
MSIVKTAALLAVVGTASACTAPLHLTYDYGRAYTESIVAQADLTRPSAAEAHYSLYGAEAVDIRIRVQEEATDTESGQTELSQDTQ